MKKLTTILLSIVLLLTFAAAETARQRLSPALVCVCGQEKCECFLQFGDRNGVIEVARELLAEKGYDCAGKRARKKFDESLLTAVSAYQADIGIPVTGMLDDLTWTYLLDNFDTEIQDDRAVWISTNYGERLHVKQSCSLMKETRMLSMRNAMVLDEEYGVNFCKRCK